MDDKKERNNESEKSNTHINTKIHKQITKYLKQKKDTTTYIKKYRTK